MFGDPILNDKNWETNKLNDVAPINKCNVKIENQDGKVWLLNLDMIEADSGRIIDFIYEDEHKIPSSTVRFDTDCVLYSKLRPYLNKVVIPPISGYGTSELITISTKNLDKQFLATLLRLPAFVNLANGSAYGAKMPRASVDMIKSFDLISPPLSLQKEFGCFVVQVDKSKHFEVAA